MKYKKPVCVKQVVAGLLVSSFCLLNQSVLAASCCGGGSASSLVLPKFSSAMIDVSMDIESYDGFWNQDGAHLPDPPNSDLNQYRLNLSYAHRFASRWQGSATLPYVWNSNKYAGLESNTRGLGDASISMWYEAFDAVKCVWKVRKPADLMPAAYFGTTLTLPTGISPYNNVENSFDITGRGFYRLDANLLLDKTIYPWNATLFLSYGAYLDRPVNREYGSYIEPYDKNLGNRQLISASVGYTYFLESMDSMTLTFAFSDLREDKGTINGNTDPTTGFMKNSITSTMAYSTLDNDWIYKVSWNHSRKQDGWGENFPATDILTLGVSHVLR
ncbi:hypothetical protein MNBD_GAMMA25-112 [hydrothermal vent metagenome]|uniref:Uncharacterized protein n=1 Tax=hydrothermal vent metagenome TaxID=652676 RepID=A0A3B1BF54_9ZZZZ